MTCTDFTPYKHFGFSNYSDITQKIETPVYVYDSEIIRNQYQNLQKIIANLGKNIQVRYAIKANSNQAILKLLHEQGCGVEVVSGGELLRALKAGISCNKIIFSGVGKTEKEITFAIQSEIEQLSVESLEELHVVKKIATALQKPISIGLRLNPNIEAKTHKKITTGTDKNKFGIPLEQLMVAVSIAHTSNYLNFLGISVHIGSQIQDINAYRQVFKQLKNLAVSLTSKGYPVRRLDLGGGFYVPYTLSGSPQFDLKAYAQAFQEELGDLNCEFVIEPGRYLVAEAGLLLTKVLYVKKTPSRTFVIVDAGMNDMIRTALYGIEHPIVLCSDKENAVEQIIVDVVGPVCESSDSFATQISLPKNLKASDILAITHTGAYGTSLSSTYNSRPLIPEVMIDKGDIYLIRESITPEHLSSFETFKRLT
ncbi:MAG: diaminopimelate decarboxylase [Alphaproteobacteria bacterium]|nr:diaminopimelate decarboxylase [Alphaproteobacteria bacterium]